MNLDDLIAIHRGAKVIPFPTPKDARWLLCACNKCKARREALPRVG